MKKIPFGKTGVEVSRLGFGSMRLPMIQIGGQDFVDIDLKIYGCPVKKEEVEKLMQGGGARVQR